ncbi:MAG: hypothetical protein UZ14_CFX002000583 [Chloroflexi bacterium OLB14]|nr:MAG: hypothetical protein UZ14_CFX002000583 [Chloroflexi bacterium OLB14]
MNKKLILFTLSIFLFVGCVQEKVTLTENVVIPTVTKISPSSTPRLIKPTPTIYLSPFSTLSALETYDKLYNSEFECDKPCWWGIIPGFSTWIETKQFIEQFSVYVYSVDKVNNEITKSEVSDSYMWFVAIPDSGSDTTTAVFFVVQNNVVSAIKIGAELVEYFYPPHKILEEYGQPDQIFISNSEYSVFQETNYAQIYILYEDVNILTSYFFYGSNLTNPLNICLDEEHQAGNMYLWSPSTELDFDFSILKPLEQFSELNVETFYQTFIDDANKCFEVSKEAWD